MAGARTLLIRGGLTAALLLGAVAAEGSGLPGDGDALERPRPTFQVRGRVARLVPGRPATLRVRVTNRYAFPIRVERVGATTTSRSPACSASNLVVRSWRGSRRVPPEAGRRVALRVKLRRQAPIACAGVRFGLHYTGRAVRVTR